MKQRILFALLMSFILSLLMTCWVTAINLGITEQFIWQWLHAFWLAWPAAGIISFLFSPMIQKFVLRLA